MEKRQEGGSGISWRPASTVILVREHEGEVQVYLLKRSAQSGFFPGNYVFPGGTVDSEDRMPDLWEGHADIAPDEISKRLGNGISLNDILAYCVTAIRETFEEAGALLCHPGGNEPRVCIESLCDRRLLEGLQRGWFWKVVVSEGWVLGLSILARWAHWFTPELMRHHFETRFFVALMPEDQTCSPDSREMTDGIWLNPKKALHMNLEGKIPLSPPTIVTLHELMPYENLEKLKGELETRHWGNPRLPRLVPVSKGAVILQPWDPQRNEKSIEIDTDELEGAVLPVGEPFSRLWLKDGIWRPVR